MRSRTLIYVNNRLVHATRITGVMVRFHNGSDSPDAVYLRPEGGIFTRAAWRAQEMGPSGYHGRITLPTFGLHGAKLSFDGENFIFNGQRFDDLPYEINTVDLPIMDTIQLVAVDLDGDGVFDGYMVIAQNELDGHEHIFLLSKAVDELGGIMAREVPLIGDDDGDDLIQCERFRDDHGTVHVFEVRGTDHMDPSTHTATFDGNRAEKLNVEDYNFGYDDDLTSVTVEPKG